MNHDDWGDDEGVVAFTDVMGAPDATGRVGLDPIVRAAHADLDVLLGVFTDEEVHWTGGDPTAAPDAFIDAPRLATYTREEQDAALTATIMLLQARGQASYESHDDELALHGVHAVLADVRNDCEAAISVRLDVPGEGTDRAAIYRVRHDLYLCQDVSREGLHRFTFLSPEQQAGWLAATIDPFHLVRDDNGPTRTVEELDELSPHPDELARRCRTSAQLVGRRTRRRQPACPDRLHHRRGGGVAPQRVDAGRHRPGHPRQPRYRRQHRRTAGVPVPTTGRMTFLAPSDRRGGQRGVDGRRLVAPGAVALDAESLLVQPVEVQPGPRPSPLELRNLHLGLRIAGKGQLRAVRLELGHREPEQSPVGDDEQVPRPEQGDEPGVDEQCPACSRHRHAERRRFDLLPGF